MLNVYNLTPFDLIGCWQTTLTSLFILFGFSVAMPLFLMLLSVVFLLKFWIYKIILIKYSGKTPSYSKDLVDNILVLIKTLLIIKNLLTIYFLGTNDVFPYSPQFSLIIWNI
jgi:hypothetical protein